MGSVIWNGDASKYNTKKVAPKMMCRKMYRN